MRPALPGAQVFTVRLPGKASELLPERLLGRLRKVKQEMMRKLTPAELAGENANAIGGLSLPSTRSSFMKCGPDLPDTDFAKMQVWRQAATCPAVGAIPPVRVVAQRLIEKAGEKFARPTLAGTPRRTKTSGPVDRRFQAQFGQLERGGPPRKSLETTWGLLRQLGCWLCQTRFPEWREDLIGLPLLSANRPRFEQQRAVEALRNPPVLWSAAFTGVALDDCGFVAAIPEHGACTGTLSRSRIVSRVGPRRMIKREPSRRSEASSCFRDWCSHQRDAAPGGQAPSSSGAQMNTGMTGPPRRTAASIAGLSARRRSCRNQTMEPFMSRMSQLKSEQCCNFAGTVVEDAVQVASHKAGVEPGAPGNRGAKHNARHRA